MVFKSDPPKIYLLEDWNWRYPESRSVVAKNRGQDLPVEFAVGVALALDDLLARVHQHLVDFGDGRFGVGSEYCPPLLRCSGTGHAGEILPDGEGLQGRGRVLRSLQ
jgi:hypothetical protein